MKTITGTVEVKEGTKGSRELRSYWLEVLSKRETND
jgi:hypothetical protein